MVRFDVVQHEDFLDGHAFKTGYRGAGYEHVVAARASGGVNLGMGKHWVAR